MDKNQLLYEQAQISAKKFSDVLALVRYVVSAVTVLGAIYLFFQGLAGVLNGRGEGEINAFATVVSALGMDRLLLSIWAGGTTIAWSRERAAKKRAIREKSKYQKIVEGDDKYRSSSGLTIEGDTPLGEEI